MKRAWWVFVCGLSIADAGAALVNLTMENLATNGWTSTATYVYGGTTNATVTQTADHDTANFRFFTGSMPVSWQFQWAGISTDGFANTMLSNITSVRIRLFGVSGESAGNWQPPTFTWVVDKGDTNQRCITWKPWSNGNSRLPGVWSELDAATTGQWFVEETGASYNSLAALQAALPNAYFEFSAELPADWGYASQQAFNVGNCPLYDQDRAWFSGATGYVDWFEIGVGGNVTRYDLGAIPEPSPLVSFAAALALLSLQAQRQRSRWVRRSGSLDTGA
jgi:hypothetical protein